MTYSSHRQHISRYSRIPHLLMHLLHTVFPLRYKLKKKKTTIPLGPSQKHLHCPIHRYSTSPTVLPMQTITPQWSAFSFPQVSPFSSWAALVLLHWRRQWLGSFRELMLSVGLANLINFRLSEPWHLAKPRKLNLQGSLGKARFC